MDKEPHDNKLIKLGWNIGSSMPSSFNVLTRINAIGGISLETEQIDASALEDYVTRYIAGRQDTGKLLAA